MRVIRVFFSLPLHAPSTLQLLPRSPDAPYFSHHEHQTESGLRGGEMVQLVNYLQNKHEDLSSIPRTHIKEVRNFGMHL